MSKLKNPVQLGVVGAAQGIKGEVRVKTYTADPLALDDYGPLQSADGRVFEITDIRLHKDMAVVRFKGVADRNAAEALTGTALFVDRSVLPEDLDEEEFYHADLIGLDAVDLDGAPLGKVVAVQNFGGGDILEIGRGRSSVMVPFTRAAVPVVDVAMRTLRVDPAAAGLLDDGEDEASEDGYSDDHAPEGGKSAAPAIRSRPRGPRSAGGNR